MRNLFEHTSASWVRYSDYEWKTADNGILCLTPAEAATPQPYDPMAAAEPLVLAAMDIGLQCFRKDPEGEIKTAIRDFARNYGLLGILTALPTTARFVEYEKVYLPKNQLIREESLDTNEYLDYFFPFEKPDFVKQGVESSWTVEDPAVQALALTYGDAPQAKVMSFLRQYAERYDWLVAVFRDWAFTFMTTVLYYADKDTLDATTKELYHLGMAAFDGNAPTYHLELREHPTMVWDFHSLLANVKLLFSIMLTDESHPLRMCRNCHRAFIAKRKNEEYCSPDCRGRYKAGK